MKFMCPFKVRNNENCNCKLITSPFTILASSSYVWTFILCLSKGCSSICWMLIGIYCHFAWDMRSLDMVILLIKGMYRMDLVFNKTEGENFYKKGHVKLTRLKFLFVSLSFTKCTSLYWSSSIFKIRLSELSFKRIFLTLVAVI